MTKSPASGPQKPEPAARRPTKSAEQSAREALDAELDEALRESFPASDPPAIDIEAPPPKPPGGPKG